MGGKHRAGPAPDRRELLFNVLALGLGCGFAEVPLYKSVNE